ncbi:MAG: GAF domain-containing protein [Clostridia bacterium]|nr:GAF domain-containing protein [Clostridia bacterium]
MTDYSLVCSQLSSLLEGSRRPLSAMANCAALLWQSLEDLNWAGFYLLSGDTLCLGPFQGKPACTEIRVGRGVCGTCVRTGEIQVVPDVHQFPGHIACDSASRSEIVLPLRAGDRLVGVMDIDSPSLNRFSEADRLGLEELCAILMTEADWDRGLI